jgi:hypothetical protein
MTRELPTPKFQHFERVVVKGEVPRCKDYQGERGTIIWLDSSAVLINPALPDQWLYIVHLPTHGIWRTFFQSDLESEGDLDPESAHLGKRREISFDLALDKDNGWMEGSYRLPGELWKVVIFQKDDVPDLRIEPSRWQRPTRWEREITGVVIRFPRTASMGRDDLLRAMSQAFGCSDWVQVHGPDSIILR